jgi:hypothetical protein
MKIAETDFRWRPTSAKTGDPVQLVGQCSAKRRDLKCQLLRTARGTFSEVRVCLKAICITSAAFHDESAFAESNPENYA